MSSKTPFLQELGEFLKVRRSELTPDDVGLPDFGMGRRRVQGLRREEVAQLAAISTDYYMRIEQGRLAPSPPVLAAIIRALRLDRDQATYVEGLVRESGQRPRGRSGRVQVHPHLVRLMTQLADTPAIVFGPRLDILAWNELAAALMLDFGSIPDRERNYVRLVFTHPALRALYLDWEDVARTSVEVLRMQAGESPNDPALATLVGELSIVSADFRRWWAAHRVVSQDFGTKVLQHPQVGQLTLDWDTFSYAGAPEQQLVLWSAEPGSASSASLALLAPVASSAEPRSAPATSERRPDIA